MQIFPPLLAPVLLLAAAGLSPAGEVPVWIDHGDYPEWAVDPRRPEHATSPPPALWRSPPGAVGTLCGDPVLVDDRLLVGTNNQNADGDDRGADGGVMACLDAADGSLVWRHFHPRLGWRFNDVPASPIRSRPAALGDRVCYLSNRGSLVCLDLMGFRDGENDGPVTDESLTGETDGDVVWEIDFPADHGVFKREDAGMGNPLSSPVILSTAAHGDLVLCGTMQGTNPDGAVPNPAAPTFVAVRLSDGQIVWSTSVPGADVALGSFGSPAVLGEGEDAKALFPAGDGKLYAFEPATGRQLWSIDLGGPPPTDEGYRSGMAARDLFYGRPVVSGRTIFVGLNQKERSLPMTPAFAVEVDADGLNPRIRWRYAADDVRTGERTINGAGPYPSWAAFGGTRGAVAVTDRTAFVLGRFGVLGAADRGTGEERWRAGFIGAASLYASPSVHDALLYVPTDDGLFVFEATADAPRCVGCYQVGTGHYSTPLPTNDGLYFTGRSADWKLKLPRELLRVAD